jgi:HSP20 family protein
MVHSLVPDRFFRFPSFSLPSGFEEDEDWSMVPGSPGGLSISEDDKNVYIEAAVPGVEAGDVDVTFDKGMLWVKAEAKEEEKDKKYYRKATRSFSYRIAVPGDIDPNSEPEATYANGVMKVTFVKSPASQPKKIQVKSGK